MRPIYVLIACEESQEECRAFRRRGFVAYSCDVQSCAKSANPAWHIKQDVTPFLRGRRYFRTQDGRHHRVPRWDLVICHPPCTYLCKVSSVQMVHHGEVDTNRFANMLRARDFFFCCLNARAPFVAVENPLPMRRAQLPQPNAYACPSWYGHKYTKKTLYWLKNLPPLFASVVNADTKSFVLCSRGKYRSRTFSGLADAIAEQWGDYVREHLTDCLPAHPFYIPYHFDAGTGSTDTCEPP